MSIIIEGMEAKDNCSECPFYSHRDLISEYDYCWALGAIFNDDSEDFLEYPYVDILKEKLPNCPVRDVPENARLIDATALQNSGWFLCRTNFENGTVEAATLGSVPTITEGKA